MCNSCFLLISVFVFHLQFYKTSLLQIIEDIRWICVWLSAQLRRFSELIRIITAKSSKCKLKSDYYQLFLNRAIKKKKRITGKPSSQSNNFLLRFIIFLDRNLFYSSSFRKIGGWNAGNLKCSETLGDYELGTKFCFLFWSYSMLKVNDVQNQYCL